VHELDHVAGVHHADHLIVEFIHDVLANEHCLNVELHVLRVIGYWVYILWYLDNIVLFKILVEHHESIAHGAFSERILSDADE
jgi:hypothetical protein